MKALTGIAKDVNNIEFNQKIIELQQKLLEIQIEYGNLLDENRALRDEVEASRTYAFHHSVNWKKLADGNEEGPFCPICFAEKKTMMPLEYRGPYSANKQMNLFVCPIRHVPKGEGFELLLSSACLAYSARAIYKACPLASAMVVKGYARRLIG